MYFTRWNPFCQIVSTENVQDLRNFALRIGNGAVKKQAGGSGVTSTEPPQTAHRIRTLRACASGAERTSTVEAQLPFFAILDQESFRATVRLNTGCSLEWSFGSEKK